MNLLNEYSQEVLSFRIKGEPEPAPANQLSPERMEQWIARCLRTLQQRKINTVLLFGMGSGELANTLAIQAPPQTRLVAVELVPANARAVGPLMHERWEIIADSSQWACFCLAASTGITASNAHLCLNPELPADKSRSCAQSLQRLMMRVGHEAISLSDRSETAPSLSLSVAAILSPDEPELEAFFAQIPNWVHELCIVWDAPEVPARAVACSVPVRQTAHPLDDFSSQRNRMLSLCTGSHVLYLDGDELFQKQHWNLIPLLCSHDQVGGILFPRQTLYPDDAHTKIGLGLWPDLQLRLFRNTNAVHFERPIHEKLAGVDQALGIALDIPIMHYSRLRKTQQQLEAKLARFDQAASKNNLHLLNREYPKLSTAILNRYAKPNQCRMLILPKDLHT